MIRKYALVILDKQDKIIDRYNLDLVTDPTDNGFTLNLSTISSDIEDIITKVVQKKQIITMNVIQYLNAYTKTNILANWIQKYSTAQYRMCLEYDDTTQNKYCEGKVTGLSKGEKDEYGEIIQKLSFTMATPYFIKQEKSINIKLSSVGKRYPYRYPYSYGTSKIENNEINNIYILDIPLIITITGAISNPTISLVDENNKTYNTVKFTNFTLNQNEQLVINSAQRKIYKIDAKGVETDMSAETDPSYDTFLRAKNGLSKIIVNTSDASDGFSLTGGWRQYTL